MIYKRTLTPKQHRRRSRLLQIQAIVNEHQNNLRESFVKQLESMLHLELSEVEEIEDIQGRYSYIADGQIFRVTV